MPPLDGTGHHWVPVRPGCRVHAAVTGHGPDLVLVHGWPGHWYCWRDCIPDLARDHRVIAVDLPGFGWSDPSPGGYALDRLADHVLVALSGLGVRRFRLLTHDWGGMVGHHMALAAPDRVLRHVTTNTGHLWMEPTPGVLRALAPLFTYQWLMAGPVVWRWGPRWVAAVIGDLQKRSGVWSPAAHESFVSQFRDVSRAAATRDLYRRALLVDLPRVLAGRYRGVTPTVATLQLHGGRDPVVRPTIARGFRGDAGAWRFEVLPRSGHFPPEDDPAGVVARAREFFSSPAPSPSRAGPPSPGAGPRATSPGP
jgi:pimeloyl-ACP methyl ester carboxylesterase